MLCSFWMWQTDVAKCCKTIAVAEQKHNADKWIMSQVCTRVGIFKCMACYITQPTYAFWHSYIMFANICQNYQNPLYIYIYPGYV